MHKLEKYFWPLARLDEALQALARRQGLVIDSAPIPAFSDAVENDRQKFGQWLETAASHFGLEAELTNANYNEVELLMAQAAPALLRLTVERKSYLLVVLGSHRQHVDILDANLVKHRLPGAEIRAWLCEPLEAPRLPEIDLLLENAGVPVKQHSKTRRLILREQLEDCWIGDCWIIRLPLRQSLWQQMRALNLPGRFIFFVATYSAYYLLWILSWWLVGKGALEGQLDPGWLMAWVLLLLTLLPLHLLAGWVEGLIATGMGTLIKQRLLFGALQLNPDAIRHQGAGQLFSRVTESETLETLALHGGFHGLFAIIEIVLSAFVIAAGPAGLTQLVLLAVWVALILLLAWRFLRARANWTDSRLQITHNLVEHLVGHRTRVAQENASHWHREEDQELENYLAHSQKLDRVGTVPMALAARGMMVVGLIGLAPSFINGQTSPALFAVGLGGILLAYRALLKLTASLSLINGAIIAWKQLTAFLKTAEADSRPTFAALLTTDVSNTDDNGMLVQAQDLVFRYRENGKPVLDGYNLQIEAGERILLQGPSGGGKSTLASILTGLRQPNSGLLLLNGLDWQTLSSAGWRRHIVAAPQFHENHVLTGTFAFNLLMGRRWPPLPEDLEEAEALCHELGLGELLQRMPAGLMQMVGETGWQLSHGERSRLYMARALLQNADLIILDESFAALDPENLQKAMQCAINRAKTLMVIAHP